MNEREPGFYWVSIEDGPPVVAEWEVVGDDPGDWRSVEFLLDRPRGERVEVLSARLVLPGLNDPTDEQCRAAARADAEHRLAGYHWPPHFVIRDHTRPHGDDTIWRGPDSDPKGFRERLEVERMRIVLRAALRGEGA